MGQLLARLFPPKRTRIDRSAIGKPTNFVVHAAVPHATRSLETGARLMEACRGGARTLGGGDSTRRTSAGPRSPRRTLTYAHAGRMPGGRGHGDEDDDDNGAVADALMKPVCAGDRFYREHRRRH